MLSSHYFLYSPISIVLIISYNNCPEIMNKMEYKSNSSQGDMLEDCLKNILNSIKPSVHDEVNRACTFKDNVIRSIASHATVNMCGSTVSNLHSKWSDLDISVDGVRLTPCVSRGDKQKALRLVKGALERTGIARNIRFLPKARVPLLSYKSKQYNISCDVTIDDAVQIKSKILKKINGFDSRFGDLVLLVKEWAKVQNINDAKSGTLNSYSLSLLVIYHLQTCDPPILPPLCEIYNGDLNFDIPAWYSRTGEPISDLEQLIKKICDINLAKFKSHTHRSRNNNSLSELLLSFFEKFSCIEELAKDQMISVFSGRLKMLSHLQPIRALLIERRNGNFFPKDSPRRRNGNLNIRSGEPRLPRNRVEYEVEYPLLGNLRIE